MRDLDPDYVFAGGLLALFALLILLPSTIVKVGAWYDGRAVKVRACRVCGCTDERACPPTCWWVGDDLCSSHGIVDEKYVGAVYAWWSGAGDRR